MIDCIMSIIIVYSSSGVAKVNSGRIASLEYKNYVFVVSHVSINPVS